MYGQVLANIRIVCSCPLAPLLEYFDPRLQERSKVRIAYHSLNDDDAVCDEDALHRLALLGQTGFVLKRSQQHFDGILAVVCEDLATISSNVERGEAGYGIRGPVLRCTSRLPTTIAKRNH